MPPKRRSAGGATSTRNQATLSFNNRSKVTKQSNIQPPSTDKKAANKRLSDQAKAEIIDQVSEIEKPAVADIDPEAQQISTDNTTTTTSQPEPTEPTHEEESTPVRPRPKAKSQSTSSSIDLQIQTASKVSDAKIKAYWKAEEDSRLAPRVHQKDVHLHEKILRHFDLSSQYGPCIGIPRMERWKRAAGLGMEPPIEVLAVLLKEEKKGVEKGVGGRQCGRLAYIDELAGGRVVLVE